MKKLLILLLLCDLLAVGGYFYKQQAEKQIAQNIEHFFSLANQADSSARNYLTPEITDQEELLTALQTDNILTLSDIKEVRLHSFNRASADITLTAGDKLQSISVEMSRSSGQWCLSNLPALTVMPLALITEATSEKVNLLTTDNKRMILQPEVAVNRNDLGFAVGLADSLIYFKRLPAVNLTKLLTHSSQQLEGENTGFHQLTSDVVYFQADNDGYKIADSTSAIVGMRNLTLYLQEEEVRAVMLPTKYVPEDIRVCLNTTDFKGLSHASATVSVTTDFTLTDKVNGKQERFQAGEKLVFHPTSDGITVKLPSGITQTYRNRLYITSNDNGRIQVETIRRGSPAFVPAYRGQLEVSLHNGSLLLVNELSLEAYLYSVVPSEMPISFGAVPLQVQAVAARSYAVAAIYRSGFRAFAAHVDDSVSSQVYGNVPEYEASTKAVNHTQGKIVQYEQNIADTRFFSTSAGVTGVNGEVWHDNDGGTFPGKTLPYLTSASQLRKGTLPQVSTETGAHQFFATTNWDSYDKNSPWFRWQVEMTRTELETVIKRYLPERYQAQPDFVLTKEGNNFTSKPIGEDALGELKDIRVIRRGQGGNIMELELMGSNNTYRILKEYNIRFTLRPLSDSGIDLVRHDGSRLTNYALLPSAYAVFNINRDGDSKVQSVLIQGGGNGHGVGMSQWGTRGLAEDGFTYADILLHYYPGSTLEYIY